jgi:hypothetical protein
MKNGQAVSSREYKAGYRAGVRLRKDARSHDDAMCAFDKWQASEMINDTDPSSAHEFVRGYNAAP